MTLSPPQGTGGVGLVTNLIRLGGLALVMIPPVLHGEDPTGRRIIVAAFMMAGANSLDSLLKSFLGSTGSKR